MITAMADEFGGPIPIGPFAIIGDDSIGRGIVETLTRPPLARGADAEPRPVHDRRLGEGCGEGGRHGRGRRAHGAHRPRGRAADPDPAGRRSTASSTATRTSTARAGTTADERATGDRCAPTRSVAGRTSLGIELGSTRIKACLIGDDPPTVLAVGSHEWENQFVDRRLDLLARRRLVGPAGRLRRPGRRRRAALRRAPRDVRRDRRLGDDARLPRLRRRRRAARAVPHLAQHDDRAARRPSSPSCSAPTSRCAGRSRTCTRRCSTTSRTSPQVRFLTTLAGYVHWQLTGPQGARRRRRVGHVPDRLRDERLRRRAARAVRRPRRRARARRWTSPTLLPEVLVAGPARRAS